MQVQARIMLQAIITTCNKWKETYFKMLLSRFIIVCYV